MKAAHVVWRLPFHERASEDVKGYLQDAVA